MLPFKLWVDADALPKILREVILRASDRYQLEVTFVANQNVGITPSVRINSIQVMSGADAADQEIIDRMKPNDIVMTQDIPLAALVIEKGGIAIHPRGEVYTSANVKARLHLRDFMDSLRGAGVNTGGPHRFLNVISGNSLVRWIKLFRNKNVKLPFKLSLLCRLKPILWQRMCCWCLFGPLHRWPLFGVCPIYI